jgi:penicillin-binding protein-related factor A (putative recombinase)
MISRTKIHENFMEKLLKNLYEYSGFFKGKKLRDFEASFVHDVRHLLLAVDFSKAVCY